jgi:hypothetical protein
MDLNIAMPAWFPGTDGTYRVPGGITYGQSIIWHERSGAMVVIRVDGYQTPETALKQALKSAGLAGWTPPRWREWWRWGDTDYSKLANGFG